MEKHEGKNSVTDIFRMIFDDVMEEETGFLSKWRRDNMNKKLHILRRTHGDDVWSCGAC